MSRSTELAKLRADFDTGKVSPEVAKKRAAQLAGGFRDTGMRGKCWQIWRDARRAIAGKQRGGPSRV